MQSQRRKFYIVVVTHPDFPARTLANGQFHQGGIGLRVYGTNEKGEIVHDVLGESFRFGAATHHSQIPPIPDSHVLEMDLDLTKTAEQGGKAKRGEGGFYCIYKQVRLTPKQQKELAERLETVVGRLMFTLPKLS